MTSPVDGAGAQRRGDDVAPVGEVPVEQAPAPPRRRHLVAALLAIATCVVALDQAAKELALAFLSLGQPVPLLGEVLSLRLIRNPGAAFSLAAGTTWVFTIVAVVVVVVILRVARRLGSAAWAAGLGLLLGGAVGNLLDRLLRPPGFGVGHVVDFIDYGGLFVGNVADIAIVSSAALIMILTLRGTGIDGSSHRLPADPPASTADERA
jgi:signal peptidase II